METKFRIWDKMRKEFYYTSNPNHLDNCQLWLSIEGGLTSVKYLNPEINRKNFILHQYTGVQDKDLHDIYESDLLWTVQGLREVCFGPYLWKGLRHVGFYLSNPWGVDDAPLDGTLSKAGNIFENRNLLD